MENEHAVEFLIIEEGGQKYTLRIEEASGDLVILDDIGETVIARILGGRSKRLAITERTARTWIKGYTRGYRDGVQAGISSNQYQVRLAIGLGE